MKTLNFAHYNSTQDRALAESRVDNTRPFDLIGRLYLTRLRLSKNSLPIISIYPWDVEFSPNDRATYESSSSTNRNYTPTGIAFFVGASTGGSDIADKRTMNVKLENNKETFYLFNSPQADITEIGMNYVTVAHLMLPRKIQWEELDNGNFRIKQDPYLIFSWEEFVDLFHFSSSRRIGESYTVIQTFRLMPTNSGISLNFRGDYQMNTPQPTNVNIPFLYASEKFLNIFGLISYGYGGDDSLGLNFINLYYSGIGLIDGESASIGFHLIRQYESYGETLKVIMDQPLGNIISIDTRGSVINGDSSSSVPSTFTLERNWNFTPDRANLFPINTLLICTPSINVPIQSIVVNSSKSQGSIVPSNIPLLKLLLLSSDKDGVDSDLLYVNDNDTASYIDVDETRIVKFVVKLYFLLKTNELVEAVLPPEGNMFIQLGLIE